MIKVSVVVPVYNIDAKYFHKCMNSILEQSFKDFEVILVDDGSTNGVEKLCDKYAERYSNFYVVHQNNKGISGARNSGTRIAKGKYLIYIDPDDWWEGNTLRFLYENMEKHSLDILIFSYFDNYGLEQTERRLWNTQETVYVELSKEQIKKCQIGILDEQRNIMPGCFGSPCMHMARLEFIRSIKLEFPEYIKKSEDLIYDLHLLSKAERVGALDISLYHYRHHSVSTCHRYTPKIKEILKTIDQELREFCGEKDGEFLEAYKSYMLKNYINILRLDFFHPENKEMEKIKKKRWKKFSYDKGNGLYLQVVDWKKLFKRRKTFGLLFLLTFKLHYYRGVKIIYKLFYSADKYK